MSIYTRRGDDGTTSLADGSRLSKASGRIEAYGAVDEANSAVGLARVGVSDTYLDGLLRFIQHRLFNCSSSLATPREARTERTPLLTADDVSALEGAIDRLETRTGELSIFIIEAGCESAARLQFARAVMRRAERRLVALAAEEPVPDNVLEFVNRCSDALFAAARYANAVAGHPEERWDPEIPPPGIPA